MAHSEIRLASREPEGGGRSAGALLTTRKSELSNQSPDLANRTLRRRDDSTRREATVTLSGVSGQAV